MPITRTPIVDDDGSGQTGTVLDNAWKQELYDQIDGVLGRSVVGHAAGTTQNASAENIGQINGPGLTQFQTLLLEIELHFTSGTAISLYWTQTATIALFDLANFGGANTNGQLTIRVYLRRHPAVNTWMFVQATGGDGSAAVVRGNMPVIDDWSAPWSVVMNHSGVPASGTLHYKISASIVEA